MGSRRKAPHKFLESWYVCMDTPEPGYHNSWGRIYEANTIDPSLGLYTGPSGRLSGVGYYLTMLPLLF